MSALTGIGILVGGPILGALAALLLGSPRAWQLIVGAALGEAVAWLVGWAWSEYAAARALRNGALVARAAELGWQDRLIAASTLVGVAILVGGLVALARRLFSPGQ